MKKLAALLIAASATVLLTGCPAGLGSKGYSREQARTEQKVEMGVVESVRLVKIEGTKSVVAPAAGAAVGGVAGSTVGGGKGSWVGATVGAVLGGVGGAAAEEAITRQMAATPLLLVAVDRLTARRARASRAADAIDDDSAPVIIAGFGRYGQIVGRVLLAQGIRITVLAHDPDQIESIRKFGYKVFYGDATRLDLLQAAGAGKAQLLVVAIDDVADSLALVDRVRESFPGLAIVARARNVRHWLELADRGVTAIERETYESALKIARATLELLGVEP